MIKKRPLEIKWYEKNLMRRMKKKKLYEYGTVFILCRRKRLKLKDMYVLYIFYAVIQKQTVIKYIMGNSGTVVI